MIVYLAVKIALLYVALGWFCLSASCTGYIVIYRVKWRSKITGHMGYGSWFLDNIPVFDAVYSGNNNYPELRHEEETKVIHEVDLRKYTKEPTHDR